jgi:hypothetical protein
MTPTALIALACCLGAPADDALVKKRAEALVAQLGHPDYRDREKAARELLEIGYAARDAVLAGQQSPDQEINERCRKLFPTIWRRDLEKRAQAFVDRPDGRIPDDLPLVERWLAIAGDGKGSREFYAEMVKAHPEVLLEVEQNPGRLMDAYRDHMRGVYGRASSAAAARLPRTGPVISEALLFLFLGAVGDVRPSRLLPGSSSTHVYQFLSAAELTAKLADADDGVPVRKLFAAWLEKERYSAILRRAMDVAAQNKVTECAPIVLRIAADRNTIITARAYAVLGFARIGNREDVMDLKPFLEDETQIATVVVNGERGAVQMRDVALGAALQLVGESPADFGFERKPPVGLATVTSYTYYAFGTDEKRDAAHKKWSEWAAKELKK